MSNERDRNVVLESDALLINIERNPELCMAKEGFCPLADTEADIFDTSPEFSALKPICLNNGLDLLPTPIDAVPNLMIQTQCRNAKGQECGSLVAMNKSVPGITVSYGRGLD